MAREQPQFPSLDRDKMRKHLKDYKDLKERVEELQTDHDKAVGALEQYEKRLREEFGVKKIREGTKLLKQIHEEQEMAEQEFAEALLEFRNEYGHLFENNSEED